MLRTWEQPGIVVRKLPHAASSPDPWRWKPVPVLIHIRSIATLWVHPALLLLIRIILLLLVRIVLLLLLIRTELLPALLPVVAENPLLPLRLFEVRPVVLGKARALLELALTDASLQLFVLWIYLHRTEGDRVELVLFACHDDIVRLPLSAYNHVFDLSKFLTLLIHHRFPQQVFLYTHLLLLLLLLLLLKRLKLLLLLKLCKGLHHKECGE